MACRTLLRKRAQHDLLAAACARRALATVAPWRGSGGGATGRLCGLRAGRLTLRWDDPAAAAALAGQPVEVHFAHDGRFYLVCGVVQPGADDAPAGAIATLVRLSSAARFDLHDRRRAARFDLLRREPPIQMIFTQADDARVRFRGRLADVSEGGVSAVVGAAPWPDILPSDAYRMSFEAGGERDGGDVLVRAVYLRPGSQDETVLIGWAFHADAGRQRQARMLRALLRLARETVPACRDDRADTRSTTHATGH